MVSVRRRRCGRCPPLKEKDKNGVEHNSHSTATNKRVLMAWFRNDLVDNLRLFVLLKFFIEIIGIFARLLKTRVAK